MRAYVTASVRDTGRAERVMQSLTVAGVDTLHNWTGFTPEPEGQITPAGREEFRKQRAALSHAHFLVLLHHPRLKAGWMEYGFCVGRNIPVLALPHPEVSDSLWFNYERYRQLKDENELLDMIEDRSWMEL